MGTTVKYKDSTIATLNNETKTLNTAGTWVEGDIVVTDETSGGSGISADDIAMRTISGVVSGSATRIGLYAFAYCSNLTIASFPQANTIRDYAFCGCSNLTTINFPQVSIIGSYAFAYCSNLTTISFPQVSTIKNNAFYDCSNLTIVSFPQAISIGSNAFGNCSSLATAIFNNTSTKQGTIYTYAFRSCYHLTSIYFLNSTLYKLSTSSTTFQSTPISNYTTSTGGVYGSIFVPESLYSAYISSTNWSYYSSRFVSLTDAQISKVLASGTHL